MFFIIFQFVYIFLYYSKDFLIFLGRKEIMNREEIKYIFYNMKEMMIACPELNESIIKLGLECREYYKSSLREKEKELRKIKLKIKKNKSRESVLKGALLMTLLKNK